AAVTGGTIRQRAEGFGLTVTEADGTDFFDVHEKAGEAIAAARQMEPRALIVHTKRFHGHFVGDAQLYRTKEEIEATRRDKDPLKHFERRVTEAKLLEPDELREIDQEIAGIIDEAVHDAEQAPHVNPRELT